MFARLFSLGRPYEANKIVIATVANCTVVGFRERHGCVTSTLIWFPRRKKQCILTVGYACLLAGSMAASSLFKSSSE
jgi:hypothetical protein